MKLAIVGVTLVSLCLFARAEAKPSLLVRARSALRHSGVYVKGRVGFATWSLANKTARQAYRAGKSAAGVGRARAKMAVWGGATLANIGAGAISLSPFNVLASGCGLVATADEATKVSTAKTNARFNAVSAILQQGQAVPKSVLRLHRRETAGRILAERKALKESKVELQQLQRHVDEKQSKTIPGLQSQLHQASALLKH